MSRNRIRVGTIARPPPEWAEQVGAAFTRTKVSTDTPHAGQVQRNGGRPSPGAGRVTRRPDDDRDVLVDVVDERVCRWVIYSSDAPN